MLIYKNVFFHNIGYYSRKRTIAFKMRHSSICQTQPHIHSVIICQGVGGWMRVC